MNCVPLCLFDYDLFARMYVNSIVSYATIELISAAMKKNERKKNNNKPSREWNRPADILIAHQLV